MKRFVIVAVAILLIPAFALAADSKVSLNAQVQTLSLDRAVDEIAVPLYVSHVDNLMAMDIPLGFTEGAELVRVEWSEMAEDYEMTLANIDNENHRVFIGVITMVSSARPDLKASEGPLAHLVFKKDAVADNVEFWPIETENPHHSLKFYYNDYSSGQPVVKAVEPEVSSSTIPTNSTADILPDAYGLSQNSPNPFNPVTSIKYAVKADGQVNVNVFNVLGQNVRTLVDQYQPAGAYEVVWDGTDNAGQTTASGIYFYRIKVNDFSETKKMVLMK